MGTAAGITGAVAGKNRAKLGPAGPRFAGVYKIDRRGHVSRLADLGAYEATHDPDTGRPGAKRETNPYSIDATGPAKILVTDAAGNDLLRVTPSGHVKTLAVLPFGLTPAPPFLMLPPGTEIPYQPVPTGVARGRGGEIYVGTLTGFPFPVGGAALYRTRGAGTPKVATGGLTTVIDVAAGDRNSVYVLQVTTTGLADHLRRAS